MSTLMMNSTLEKVPPSMKPPNKRVTIIKHVVGKVRTSSHCLPQDDFVFGIANKIDMEGAGQVLQSWSQSEPSQPRTSMTSFPATNREALQNGCLTAKAQREYAKNHPVVKQNRTSSHLSLVNRTKKKNALPPEQFRNKDHFFGIKSFANDATMTELLRCPDELLSEETDYPDRSGMQKKGRLPPAKSTKASRLLQRSAMPPSKEDEAAARAKEEFKMKKFAKVPAKVETIRKR